ncbi:hypothetical protein CROQUDRAFT_90576 [Cronartium quercuum f. sp. fusiforme G11]|uniref:Uncharacterized protein n=1 Tax=Cronartium quercuum f. sp. fusiforme G11 TaxID=708437 RepID=A0A9P6NJM2_9BASI|nr:hypothetical protein CROQUDRAFT_90576 [Cronartium quercuum f. sp. fusiforme G11]
MARVSGELSLSSGSSSRIRIVSQDTKPFRPHDIGVHQVPRIVVTTNDVQTHRNGVVSSSDWKKWTMKKRE